MLAKNNDALYYGCQIYMDIAVVCCVIPGEFNRTVNSDPRSIDAGHMSLVVFATFQFSYQ